MSNSDLPVTPLLNGSAGLAGPSMTHGDFLAADDWAADSAAGLVSFAVLAAAIRRGALFCCVMAIVGLLIGGGLYVMLPAPYQAATSILVTEGPYENGLSSAGDDQAFAQTRTVAAAAMHELGVSQNITTFLTKYVVTVESQRVLLITFNGTSVQQALRGANAVAAELLRFRAGLLIQEQQQVFGALNQQITDASQKVKAVTAQIVQAHSQPASPARTLRITNLQAERRTANISLASLQQTLSGDVATVAPATAAAIKSSRVLYPAAPLPRSHFKRILEFPVAGLIGGLALGMAIVMIRTIVSDRPRRRDDIAAALGASVRLSTGPLHRGRRLWAGAFWRGPAARGADVQRVAAHLGRLLPEQDRGVAALAIVAVDDPRAAALPMVSLASSYAAQGRHVIVADLVADAPAARLLRAGPGVRTVNAQGVRIVTAVPAPDEISPAGPLGRVPARDRRSRFTTAVATECAGADILLTLTTLDPSLGGEHLPTWAADAVVVLTAGRPTSTKINAVGEMIRLSGTRLASAIVVGADRTDESLGAILRQQAGHDDEIGQTRTEGNGSVVAAGEGGWQAPLGDR